jgi:hypothetical protein
MPMLSRRNLLWLSIAPALRAAGENADWISALGGKITRDQAGEVIAANLGGSWINDAEMMDLLAFKKLQRLDLSHTRISDEGLLHLRPAHSIQDLNLLYAEQVTDQGMNAIKEWKQLTHLNVRGTRVGDVTLGIVSKLGKVESLDVANTALTENGLEGLIPLTRIKHLAIGLNRLNDGALEILRFLTTLESLDLAGPRGVSRNSQRSRSTGIGPGLFRALSELTSLRTLKMGHTTIGADELQKLGTPLAGVQKLGLEGCPRVDDQAMKALAAWNGLRLLDVQDTAVTLEAVEILRKASPGIKILHNARVSG